MHTGLINKYNIICVLLSKMSTKKNQTPFIKNNFISRILKLVNPKYFTVRKICESNLFSIFVQAGKISGLLLLLRYK